MYYDMLWQPIKKGQWVYDIEMDEYIYITKVVNGSIKFLSIDFSTYPDKFEIVEDSIESDYSKQFLIYPYSDFPVNLFKSYPQLEKFILSDLYHYYSQNDSPIKKNFIKAFA